MYDLIVFLVSIPFAHPLITAIAVIVIGCLIIWGAAAYEKGGELFFGAKKDVETWLNELRTTPGQPELPPAVEAIPLPPAKPHKNLPVAYYGKGEMSSADALRALIRKIPITLTLTGEGRVVWASP